MTAGKVLWLLGLLTIANSVHIPTCTDLSWESKAERENFTLYNAGNHILVLSALRLDCFEDDRRYGYTNKSFLLNPGQSVFLPSDPWMSNCSATFCSACLIYQCNIITRLIPNDTLIFLYNDSDLVDFSAVEYDQQSLPRKKKYGHEVIAATGVCPRDMVSVWTKQTVPTVLIDIPNQKKKRTVYTVKLQCNGNYLLDNLGRAIKSFSYTTPGIKKKADVIVTVPLQELGETPRTCILNACLHRKEGRCKQTVLCKFTIPDNSVQLEKINRWERPQYKTIGCSQTRWSWSVLDQQTGNLNLRLRNKDWEEKSFIVSLHCNRLRTLNDSVIITIPPVVRTKLVTFPVEILHVDSSITSTTCVAKLCNTARRKCGSNTECSITLPMKNGKFVMGGVLTDNNKYSQCGSKSVVWSRQGSRRGILSIQLQNSKQETITAKVLVNCSELEVLRAEEQNLTVEVPANSVYGVQFKLKPADSIDTASLETNCVINTCDTKNCNMGELCNIAIPVENGLFPDSEGNITTNNNMTGNNDTDNCESKSVSWEPQGVRRGTVSVYLPNSRQEAITTKVSVNCSELEVLKNKWEVTVSVPANSLEVTKFKLRPKNSIDTTAVEAYCTIIACNAENCERQEESCNFDITVPVKDGLFPEEIVSNNDNGKLSKSVTWSPQGNRRGTLSVQLQNSKQRAVVAEASVNCTELTVVRDAWNLTITVPVDSVSAAEFKLKNTVDDRATETYCAVETCIIEDCENQGESYNITNIGIPVKDGFFLTSENGNDVNDVNDGNDGNDTSVCDPNSVTWSRQGDRRVRLSVQLMNSRQDAVITEASVNCSYLAVVRNQWMLTVTVPANSLQVVKFRLKPGDNSENSPGMETNCTVKICNTEDCENQTCNIDISIPFVNGLFPEHS